ncbi:hypothetical protein POF43_023540 [Streptomyces sp. SL54]|uniref:Uncharacterized protein n=1 Tax=Streptantibioticus silvisoli TaxID=2705255 RepID=A0ABT6W5K6_9ACTN|nr:hypothetical protein [Streptantibioticus silvisoli]MDI5965665.1 hypothetical protein [Streptantibioticus silvisoli]
MTGQEPVPVASAVYQPAGAAINASACGLAEPGGPRRPPAPEKVTPEKVTPEKVTPEKVTPEKVTPEKVAPEKVTPEKVTGEKVTPGTSIPGASTRVEPSAR